MNVQLNVLILRLKKKNNPNNWIIPIIPKIIPIIV